MTTPLSQHPVVSCRNVWKIFGERASDALYAAQHSGLSKREINEEYGCVVGVADASFDVQRGEIFCIMGLSGSGKSTLVRHINRLLEPTAGEILIDGEDVVAKDARALRQLRASKIGMVFQNNALLPHRTVRDNVALPLEVQGMSKRSRRDIAGQVLDKVELNGWEERFAHELSGGMQQRVNLARAMAADPDILLMDEPFSALDPLIRRQLQDQFMALSKELQKTTIFITHDLDEAIRIGDRIAIMKDGVIVQTGTPEEIVCNPADAYVADFVAGISKLKLVRAHTVMLEVADYLAQPQHLDTSTLPQADSEADLDQLIDLSLKANSPLAITRDHAVIGVVDHSCLLRGIQGGK
ncbi:MAG: quaternary amine ABC transporter ATP-binding protein [Pseudomonadales bacterium]